jgi:hypothetical protein
MLLQDYKMPPQVCKAFVFERRIAFQLGMSLSPEQMASATTLSRPRGSCAILGPWNAAFTALQKLHKHILHLQND